jgi:hypothetical protein
MTVSFAPLWAAHPSNRGIQTPCCDADGQPNVENQCAIRMGEALRDGGVDLSSYRGTKCWFHRPGHTLRAEKLARWLERRTGQFGRVKKLSNVTDEDFIGKHGMVLCMNFWGTGLQGDHIDLWDGRRLAHGSDDYFGRSQKVWFWTLDL